MKILRKITFSLFLCYTSNVCLARVNSSDFSYNIINEDKYNFIYSEDYNLFKAQIINNIDLIIQEYENSFSWKLDETTSVVLASKKNQIANAFATNFPDLTTVWYPGGLTLLDQFASSSWIKTILIHEIAHLYQLNPKQELSKFSHQLFGNNVAPFIPVLWFTLPNYGLPTWIMEGNAVFNESRFGIGGRLFSGEMRALFYALLKDNKIDKNRIINDHLMFPFTTEKYIIGGYFSEFLARMYGTAKVNQFFVENAYRYINPLLLNKSFRHHFSKDYDTLFDEFIKSHQKQADQLKFSQGEVLYQSVIYSPLNSNNSDIFFLNFSDGASRPKRVIFNKSTFKLSEELTYHKNGKLYLIGDKFYSNTTGQVEKDITTYSLWDNNQNELIEYREQLISDQRNSTSLLVSLNDIDNIKLHYKNKEYSSNGMGLIGPDERIYYFRQNDRKRTLCINDQKIFSFNSYYSKLVDINKYGDAYFIANTEYGSGLFVYKNKHIYRLTNSDAIKDARIINATKALVVETHSDGYHYKVISLHPRPSKLVSYNYSFEKQIGHSLPNKQSTTKINSATKYNTISELQFNFFNVPSYQYSSKYGHELHLLANFSDPLDYNNLLLTSSYDESRGTKDITIAYLYTRYNLGLGLITGIEDKKPAILRQRQRKGSFITTEAVIFYPFIQKEQLKLDSQLSLIYSQEYENNEIGYYTNFKFAHFEKYLLNYDPYFLYSTKLEFLKENIGNDYAIHLIASRNIGSEFYINLESNNFYSKNSYLEIYEDLYEKPLFIASERYAYYVNEFSYLARHAAELKKSFQIELYSSWFPIGLRRIAPSIIFNYYTFDQRRNFSDLGSSYDFELLFAHNYPFRVSIRHFYNSFENKNNLTLDIRSNLEF